MKWTKRPAGVALLRDLRATFRDVHQHGERALQEGDLTTFGEAIAMERGLIQEQRKLIDMQKRAILKKLRKARDTR